MKEKKLPKGAFRLDGGGQASVMFEEAGENQPKKPKIKMVAYSGGVIKDHWYWGNLGIELSGMKFPKERYPLLQQHDIETRLAHMGKPVIVDNKLMAPEDDVVFLDNDASKKFLEESSKGFPFQASMFIWPRKVLRLDEDQEHNCNGFTVKGPGAVFLESEFKEMSVCVFGADSNTSAAAFAEDEPCSFAEVDIAGNEPVQKPTEKEVKRMDKAQLKKDHPELFAEVLAEGKAQVVITADPEIKILKEAFAALSEENKALKKENEVRREKELKAEADKLFTEKLAASDLPERLHDKVKVMVDYNKFVKDQALDVKAFGEAVDAEIKDWSDRGVKKGEVVLGESTATKQATTTDKTEQATKLSDRLLSLVGQTPKK